jgi:hypothetical protein
MFGRLGSTRMKLELRFSAFAFATLPRFLGTRPNGTPIWRSDFRSAGEL